VHSIMLEIKEQGTLSFNEDNDLPEEVTKYYKRIDDLIEDAEIEAEIEAEKKIRSKNSRMLSISMVGIALLAFVYTQINYQEYIAPVKSKKENSVKKIGPIEKRISKQASLANNLSSDFNLATLQSIDTKKSIKNPFLTNSTAKSAKPSTINKVAKKTLLENTILINSNPKIIQKKLAPIKNKNSDFFILAGAFRIRKNAESLLKELKDKGFSPSIHTRLNKSNQHILLVGSFPNKKSGDKTLKELTLKGFKASYYKNPKNFFSLNVGQFDTIEDAQKIQDNLRLNGFMSSSHRFDLPKKTYIVQLGVFPSLEKAHLTKEKLIRAGFSKAFLR
jgi:cell division septation protein DedD